MEIRIRCVGCHTFTAIGDDATDAVNSAIFSIVVSY